MQKMKMGITLSTNYCTWPSGGMVNYVRNCIPILSEYFDINLYGVKVKNENMKQVRISNEEYNINCYAEVVTGRKIPLNFLRVFIGVFIHAKEYLSNDIIFCHSAIELIALRLRLRNKLPFVIYVQHGLSFLTSNRKDVKIYFKFTSTKAFKIANVNLIVSDEESYADYINKICRKTRGIFYNVGSPVDIKCIRSWKENKDNITKFVYTGRLSKEKRLDLAISAFADYIIKTNNDNTMFTFIGEGPLKQQLKEQAKKLGIDNHVCFMGQMDHDVLIKKLCEFDVFLMPSAGEGVSLSTIEAMAAGLPVVAFDVAGMKGLIRNDYNGGLAEEGVVDDFAKKMIYVVDNKESLRENAIKCAQEYSCENVVTKILNIILKEYSEYRE